MSQVKVYLETAILTERDRCARIAREMRDAHSQEDAGWYVADEIQARISSALPPRITVVRPETALKNPDALNSQTIVAGEALTEDDRIINRKTFQSNMVGG